MAAKAIGTATTTMKTASRRTVGTVKAARGRTTVTVKAGRRGEEDANI